MTTLRKIPIRPSDVRKPVPAAEPVQPLLVNRHRAAKMLGGISTSTLIRMEQHGKLKPIRLSGHPSSVVFYRVEDVERLARGEAGDLSKEG
jgi:hypothetical protein